MGKVVYYHHEARPLPNQLLLMYRQRSGLTQNQLAALLGLKSDRMIQKWESGYSMPTALRLQSLLKIYLQLGVFISGSEREEAHKLWQTVKDMFDINTATFETYPIFDEDWFAQFITTSPINNQVPPPTVVNAPIKIEQSVSGFKAVTPTLPTVPNRLIGRENEVKAVKALLNGARSTTGTIRLLTLSGAGGTGKTRLALEVASNLSGQFKDGVSFVALENAFERATFTSELATALGIKEKPGQPLEDRVKEWLSDKELLMVLDNFEQLIASGATLVAELLQSAPKLKILVTSRERLRLSQEYEYAVAPLALPDTSVSGLVEDIEEKSGSIGEDRLALLRGYAAVSLFEERAEVVKSDFKLTAENVDVVVEICKELDGLPLAIELAAARVRVLSPQKILERLSLKLLVGGSKDLHSRNQTLRGTISWSYDLLEPGEKVLFERLSIFVSGCTLEGAEAVCNVGEELELEVLDGIELLLQKNLLRQWEGSDGERRYGMLQTIREYALEKLKERGELESLAELHAKYFVQLCQGIELKTEFGENQKQNLKVIDNEYANIREILYQSLEVKSGKAEAGLALAGALGFYWRVRGYFSEGLHYLKCGLTISPMTEKKALAKILFVIGNISYRTGASATGERYLKEALDLYREMGDKYNVSECLGNLGQAVYPQGELERAKEYYSEALILLQEIGFKPRIPYYVNNLGNLAYLRGDPTSAYNYCQEALVLFREEGDKRGQGLTLVNLGNIAHLLGEYAIANGYRLEGLSLFREIGDKYGIALCLRGLSIAAYLQGETSSAGKHLNEALSLFREIGDRQGIGHCLNNLGELNRLQGAYSRAKERYLEALGLFREIEEKQGIGYCLNNLGELATLQGEWANAHATIHEALDLFSKMDSKFGIARCKYSLGLLAKSQDDCRQATKFLAESLALFEKMNAKEFMALTFNSLGHAALDQANYVVANLNYNQGLAISREWDYKREQAEALNGLASVTLEQGEWAKAARCLKESLITIQLVQDRKLVGEIFCSVIKLELQAFSQSKGTVMTTEKLIYLTKLVGSVRGMVSYGERLLISPPWHNYYQTGLAYAQAELDTIQFQMAYQQSVAQSLEESIKLVLTHIYN